MEHERRDSIWNGLSPLWRKTIPLRLLFYHEILEFE